MPTQTINMKDVYAVKFNNQNVDSLKLNNTEIWSSGMKGFINFSCPSAFSISVVDNQKHWDGTLEYSINESPTWTVWDGTTPISPNTSGYTVIHIRGTGNTYITGQTASATVGRWVFTTNLPFETITIDGNIENLLDYSLVNQGIHPVMADYCFCFLFRDNTNINIAPGGSPLAEFIKFRMPALSLSSYCYRGLFYGCTSLTSAPALPSTTLAINCYTNMFRDCTSLTSAPALPATTSTSQCYYNMFYGCTSLTSIPALPATTLVSGCYSSMFNGCTNIKISSTQTGDYVNAYRIPSSGTGTTNTTNWGSNMFANTGGTFTSNPTINTTYYTSNTIVS